MAEQEVAIGAPVIVDLGKKSSKSIKRLKQGQGKLAREVDQAVAEAASRLGDAATGKELLPVVVLYQRRTKARRSLFPFSVPRVRVGGK